MNDLMALLGRFNLVLTIRPDGSWSLHNIDKDGHFSGGLISDLIEYVEYAIHDKRLVSKVPERGDLRDFAT
jgi:hypothetical protein